MVQQLFSAFLATLFALQMNANCTAAPKDPKDVRSTAQVTPIGSAVEVRSTNQQKLRGRLAEVTMDRIAIQIESGRTIETRQMPFDAIEAIRILATNNISSHESANAMAMAVRIPHGSRMEVRLQDKEKFRGRMGAIDSDGFLIESDHPARHASRKVLFTELKSTAIVGKSHLVRNSVIGVAVAGAVFVVIIGYGLSELYGYN